MSKATTRICELLQQIANKLDAIASGSAGPHGLSIEQAATRLTVSPRTLANWAAAGKLKLARIGGRTLVPVDEIARLLSASESNGPKRVVGKQKPAAVVSPVVATGGAA